MRFVSIYSCLVYFNLRVQDCPALVCVSFKTGLEQIQEVERIHARYGNILTVGKYQFASTVYGALHSVDDIVANMSLFVLQVARGCGGLLLFHSFS